MTVSASATAATDVTNKTYVDTVATGINAHDAVSYASTSGDTATILANANVTYNNNGTGVGATLTNANASRAALVLDGYTFTGTDATNAVRVLIKDAATSAYNGIYTVTNQGSASVNWVLTRATDSDQPPELAAGDFTYVLNGNTLAKFTFIQTSKITTVGTDAITWTVLANGNFGSVVAVNQGGTGATTAALALTSLGGASLTTANTFTAAQTITPSSGVAATINAVSGSVGLVLKAGGTGGNLMEWQASDSSLNSFVTSFGALYINNNNVSVTSNVGLSVKRQSTFDAGQAGIVPVVVLARASQTANLQEWQASGGTVLGSVSSSGALTLSPSSGTAATINGVANAVTAIVNGNATQSTDIMQVFATPSGTKRLSVNSVGRTQVNARMGITPSGTDSNFGATLTVSDVTGSADLQQWQNNVGTVLSSIGLSGALTLSPSSGTALSITQPSGAIGLRLQNNATTGNFIEGFASDNTTSQFRIRGGAGQIGTGSLITGTLFAANLDLLGGTSIGAVIRGASSQSVDLQQWQDSTGATLAKIDASGNIYAASAGVIANTTSVTGAALNIIPTSASAYGILVQGRGSQSGDLMRWQNSGATVLASIASTGALTLSPSSGTAATINAAVSASAAIAMVIQPNTGGGGGYAIQFNNTSSNIASHVQSDGQFGIRTFGSGYSGSLSVGTGSSGTIGAVIRGISAQTADLQQWQATGGTVLGGQNANAQIFTGSTSPLTYLVGGTPSAAAYGSPTASRMRITLATAPGVAVGDLITVANVTGATGGNPNGTFLVTAVSNSGTFWVEYDPGTAVTGTLAVSGSTSVRPAAQATIVARSAGTIPLIVRAGGSAQQTNLAQWESSAGTALVQMTDSGKLVVGQTGTGVSPAPMIGSLSNGAGVVTMALKAASGQTADVIQVLDNSGNVNARFDKNQNLIAAEATATNATATGAVTADTSTGTTFFWTLTGNLTGITLSNLPQNGSLTLTFVLTQDATGSRTVVWTTGTKWAGGTAPTLSTAANAVDIVTLVVNRSGGSTSSIYGFLAGKAFA
jgi:hypothetical protein